MSRPTSAVLLIIPARGSITSDQRGRSDRPTTLSKEHPPFSSAFNNKKLSLEQLTAAQLRFLIQNQISTCWIDTNSKYQGATAGDDSEPLATREPNHDTTRTSNDSRIYPQLPPLLVAHPRRPKASKQSQRPQTDPDRIMPAYEITHDHRSALDERQHMWQNPLPQKTGRGPWRWTAALGPSQANPAGNPGSRFSFVRGRGHDLDQRRTWQLCRWKSLLWMLQPKLWDTTVTEGVQGMEWCLSSLDPSCRASVNESTQTVWIGWRPDRRLDQGPGQKQQES